ncbi:MAG: alkaline phosphatase family protein, partial [Candidatus Cybelea sp.]
MYKHNALIAATLLAALCAAGCTFTPSPSKGQGNAAVLPSLRGGMALRAFDATGAGKIKHVVYVIQENRSFDDMFQGYPGADTVSSGKNSGGERIPLQPISLKTQYDIEHDATAMFAACHGTGKLPGTKCRMDAFNKEDEYSGPINGQFAYVPHSESKPYFDMAHEFVLADRMFQSQLDESFVAHQYIIAAQAKSSVNIPDLQWGCEGGVTDSVPTITHRRQYG